VSIAALQWAKQRTTGSAATKLVLLVLADYASPGPEDGQGVPSLAAGRHFAYAGQERVARECEMSVATVRRHQTELVELGLIRKAKRFDRTGNRTSDYIVLAVDDHRARPFEDAGSGSHHSADPTTGQIDLRSPVSGGPALTGERVTTSPEPPDHPTGGSAPRSNDADYGSRLLAEHLINTHRGKIAIPADRLSGLLRPALANGVSTATLSKAIKRMLGEGKPLVGWCLSEYVAKVASTSNLPFVQ
jgi:hypothetical protein